MSTQALWDKVFSIQDEVEDAMEEPWFPLLFDTDKPFVVAFMSDMHLGSPFVDYKRLYRDSQIIANTEGISLIVVGDERDNMITDKLYHVRRENQVSLPQELHLYKSWVDMVKHKMEGYVTGNHDLWTFKASGIDLAEMIVPCTVLYDKYEIRIVIMLRNGMKWKLRIRHRWSGRSYLNLTNGIERDWQFCNFDIGIGGDYHDATICREFIRDGKRRFAILLGTYKNLGDPYHKKIGKQQSPHLGCGAIMFFPDGRLVWYYDIELAAKTLNLLRGNHV